MFTSSKKEICFISSGDLPYPLKVPVFISLVTHSIAFTNSACAIELILLYC